MTFGAGEIHADPMSFIRKRQADLSRKQILVIRINLCIYKCRLEVHLKDYKFARDVSIKHTHSKKSFNFVNLLTYFNICYQIIRCSL